VSLVPKKLCLDQLALQQTTSVVLRQTIPRGLEPCLCRQHRYSDCNKGWDYKEHTQSALWKILIRIRIWVFGIVQIDEIDIVIDVIGGGNGPNRKRTLLAAKTSKGFLLLGNIANDIRTFAWGMVHVATTEAFSIQFRHDEIISRLDGGIIVERWSLSGSFNGPNIAITRGLTSSARTLCTTATTGSTIGTTKTTLRVASSRTCGE